MIAAHHQPRQEFQVVLYLPGESLTNAARVPRDVCAECGAHAAGAGRVAMSARQVTVDDRGKRALTRVALQRALPDALASRKRKANRFGRDSFFGAELAVQPAVREARIFGYRVNAGCANAMQAEQARGR